MKKFNYRPKDEKQLRAWYYKKDCNDKHKFGSYENFKEWHDKQNKVCHYCGLAEEDSQKIVVKGYLTSKRFPSKGKIKRGRARGMWLEVDRKDPKGKYSKDNCVLCCYFCNNDKSDVFEAEEYKSFLKDRVGFLRKLLKRKIKK